MGAKFSTERVCNCKGDQDLVSVGGVFFPLTAGLFPTDKTKIFVVSDCYDPENYHVGALQGRWL